jgi:predicted nuclease with TOPRIM domain
MEDAMTATQNGTPPLDDRIAERVEELRGELRAGRERMRELDAERARIQETILRIEGAILALEELTTH